MTAPELIQPTTLAGELVFLSPSQAAHIKQHYQTPCYIYSASLLRHRAKQALAFPAPYGLTVRYAMKANPLAAILKLFLAQGIHIDASSGAEAQRAIRAGIPAHHIMLTSQEIPENLSEIIEAGVIYNASSLHQLESFGRNFSGRSLLIRLNPGTGSGHTRSVSVAGPTSSFGIWHKDAPAARAIAAKLNLHIVGIHSHIGCGADPVVWQAVATKTLSLLEEFPEATRLNLGGGFRVARYHGEHATSLHSLGQVVSSKLKAFAARTGRKLHLEIEPGTFLVANAGTLLTEVIDITTTGPDGYQFAKLNTGMNDFMRPALHASQHPIIPLISPGQPAKGYIVVGHNCESTDLLTPDPQDSETLLPRLLPELGLGTLIAIEGVGAYCSAMRLIGYNSYATPNEVIIEEDGEIKLINRRLTFADFIASEVA